MNKKQTLEKLYSLIPAALEKVYQAGNPTPLETITSLPYQLYLKREDLGPINAYKWRGAFNAVLNHHIQNKCDIVVAASAGNHAQGVALAAKMLGIQAKIFMPLSAPLMKQNAVKTHGGDHIELILTGDDYNEAGAAAKKYIAETGYTYIHPFDDLYTMAGQATIAHEAINDTPQAFDYAFLQIGGGGMAGGVAAWLKKYMPDIKIIGVEGTDQASMKASYTQGSPITLDEIDNFCDGTAVTRPGNLTFDICSQMIDEFITVSNEEVSAAIQQLWEYKRLIPEPSGAMGLAGLNQYYTQNPDILADKNILCIICGANMDFNKLSLIASKSAIGAHRRRYYRIALPEKNGALLHILEKYFQNLNVSEFMYGKTQTDQAWQTIAIDATQQEFHTLEDHLKSDNIMFSDVSLQADIRYRVINYNPHLFKNPLFMTVRFAERKGALREFLRQISPIANICYFNYAYSGESIGRALMGFEFTSTEKQKIFQETVKNLNIKCEPIATATAKRILERNGTNKS